MFVTNAITNACLCPGTGLSRDKQDRRCGAHTLFPREVNHRHPIGRELKSYRTCTRARKYEQVECNYTSLKDFAERFHAKKLGPVAKTDAFTWRVLS